MNDHYYLYSNGVSGELFIVSRESKSEADLVAWIYCDDPIFHREITAAEADDFDAELY